MEVGIPNPILKHARGRVGDGCARSRGFTLVELLVTIAIIGVLIGLLAPALGRGVAAARAFRCEASLRSIAFDFTVFADDSLHGSRGNDERELTSNRFRLETFIESQYGIDEFWNDDSWGDAQQVTRPAGGNDVMRCAEVAGPLTMRRKIPCSQGALSPSQNVSYGFNYRLGLKRDPNSLRPRYKTAELTSAILRSGSVPLAWDVDGAAAAARDANPSFSAPTLEESTGPFANGAFWFPGARHAGGTLNVAFVDGSVKTSRRPLEESGWLWGYSPR